MRYVKPFVTDEETLLGPCYIEVGSNGWIPGSGSRRSEGMLSDRGTVATYAIPAERKSSGPSLPINSEWGARVCLALWDMFGIRGKGEPTAARKKYTGKPISYEALRDLGTLAMSEPAMTGRECRC